MTEVIRKRNFEVLMNPVSCATAVDRASLCSVDPATGDLLREYPVYDDAACEVILRRLDVAAQRWKHSSHAERAACAVGLGKALRQNLLRYSALITAEMGKPLDESRLEIEKCIALCEFSATHAAGWLADVPVATEARKSLVVFEPLGVVLAIMPWNFPFWQVCRTALAALLAGNGCALKHAANVTGCALALEEAFQRAGFPEDLFRALLIPSERVEGIIRHAAIKGVALTGSTEAGARVAAIAGSCLKKTVLELGGSDPCIVLADADLDACCPTALASRMKVSGQACIAAKRFIVERAIFPSFLERFVALASALRVGDPLNLETQLGPLAREDLLHVLEKQVQDSLQAGAQLKLGGFRLKRPGFYYAPTVLTDVGPGMPAYHDELFGPVAAIICVDNAEQALAVANETDYGLGAAIWTRDVTLGERLARSIEAGVVFVNDMTRSDPRLPFGGIKKSGYGRELSCYGIKEFVNMKTVWIA